MMDANYKPVTCPVCPHACVLFEGCHGICKARVARGGSVVDENYGRVTSLNLDPIEKKPLAFWNPGSWVLSVGSYGCNMHCPFCQNASIACANAEEAHWNYVEPEALVRFAGKVRDTHDFRHAIGIAYTYNEPLIGYEYVRDVSKLAHEAGLYNVLVRNGMANFEIIDELLPLIDAANIDLKGFSQDFYNVVGGDFDCVKRTIELFAAFPKTHLEVTTLVIPGLNDMPEEIDKMSQWIASLDPSIPYHLTRFFPTHCMTDRQATSIACMHELKAVAERHLSRVVLGNV
ncbi:AmmeMemoRadiSam system radical SAM enzyme [Eggerthellaceae bacterium 3-80]